MKNSNNFEITEKDRKRWAKMSKKAKYSDPKSISFKIHRYFSDHQIIKFLLIMFIILLVVYGAKSFYETYKTKVSAHGGLDVIDEDELIEILKKTDSDIDGMTQYDKYKMGLDYEDDSDSDHDGLTDKEEIEVYGTDPLKASSAGDLYTDSYKVEMGMDTSKYYDMEKVSFNNNQCSEVLLTAECVEDLSAVVENATDRYSLTDYGISTIYKGYWIYNYSGTVRIDLTDVLEKSDNIDIYVYEGDFLVYGLSDLEKCKYSLEDNIAELSYDFDGSSRYFVYVVEKASLKDLIFNSGTSNKLQLNSSSDDEAEFLLQTSGLLFLFGHQKATIYYVDQGSEIENDLMIEQAKAAYDLGDDKATFEAISANEIQKKYEFYQKLFPAMESDDGLLEDENGDIEWNKFFINLFFVYWHMDADNTSLSALTSGTNSKDADDDIYANYHTSFDPYTDEFLFQNFGSKYGAGGNCAGIATFTSYLFNHGTFPSTGTYNDISYDLNNSVPNATLMDPGLDDFHKRAFVDDRSSAFDNYIDGTNDSEYQFINMIGYCQQKTNATLREAGYCRLQSNDWLKDWSLVEKITSRLDQGEVVNIGIYLKEGYGHALTLYDYYYNNSGELIFRVYDSNYPQNHMDDVELACDGACYLQCKKVLRSDGTYGLTYLYAPIANNSTYVSSSNPAIMDKNKFEIWDSDLNILN